MTGPRSITSSRSAHSIAITVDVRQQIFEREVFDFARGQPVEIDVLQRHGWSAIFLDDGESGGADGVRVEAEPFREAADEDGLARAEVAVEKNDRAGGDLRGQRASSRVGLGFGLCECEASIGAATRRG